MDKIFSGSVENFLPLFAPQHQATLFYPTDLEKDTYSEIRKSPEESLHSWFKRVATGISGAQEKEIDSVQFNQFSPHLLILARIVFSNKEAISITVDALISKECELIDILQVDSLPDEDFQYYRLDYSPNKPGLFYKEPLPHIHCEPKGAPRIPISTRAEGNIIFSFLEFIYLNHFYNEWKTWFSQSGIIEDPIELAELLQGYKDGNLTDSTIQDIAKKANSGIEQHWRRYITDNNLPLPLSLPATMLARSPLTL